MPGAVYGGNRKPVKAQIDLIIVGYSRARRSVGYTIAELYFDLFVIPLGLRTTPHTLSDWFGRHARSGLPVAHIVLLKNPQYYIGISCRFPHWICAYGNDLSRNIPATIGKCSISESKDIKFDSQSRSPSEPVCHERAGLVGLLSFGQIMQSVVVTSISVFDGRFFRDPPGTIDAAFRRDWVHYLRAS